MTYMIYNFKDDMKNMKDCWKNNRHDIWNNLLKSMQDDYYIIWIGIKIVWLIFQMIYGIVEMILKIELVSNRFFFRSNKLENVRYAFWNDIYDFYNYTATIFIKGSTFISL